VRVYIAVATSDTQHVKSLKSCYGLNRRDGDGLFFPDAFATGHVTRGNLALDFLGKPAYDAIMPLDADQIHPEGMLEHLRESMETNDLDMVCAHYYRRQTRPVQSLCYELGDGSWPFLPMLHPPRSGLHEIGSSGFGCVLIHRRVMEAVQDYLDTHHGKGGNPFDIGTLPEITGDSAHFGSDFRFFLIARKLGFKLWLDADVESLHAVTVWIGHRVADRLIDYGSWADDATDLLEERIRLHGMNADTFKMRKRILEARKLGLRQEYDAAALKGDTEAVQKFSAALFVMDGRLYEMDAWIEWREKYERLVSELDPESAAKKEMPNLPFPDKTIYGPNRTVEGHFYTAKRAREYGEKCYAAGREGKS